MAFQAVKAQTAESTINNLLAAMGVKVDEAVGSAISALLHADSHVVAGVLESSVAIQDLERTLDQTVFSALEGGFLEAAEIKRLTSAIAIGKDLSRLGKLAANLGRKVTEVGRHHEHEDFSRSSRWPSQSLIFAGKRCVRWCVSIRCWRAMPHMAVFPWMLIVTMFCVV
jgi:Phosphate uptake regulator